MFHILLDILIAIGLLVSCWLYVTSWVGARLLLRRARIDRDQPQKTPGITVLKPLKGQEPDLYANLLSFFEQDYPEFELIFGVADSDDPALSVVRRLQAAYPHVRAAIVVDDRIYGTNYKVSNLQNMYGKARYDFIVLADSDICVARDYLRRLAAPLSEPDVGVVTCLYRARHSGDLPSRIESLFVNTDFIPNVLVARIVEPTRYAFGATIAIRRGVLDEIGGFLGLSNYLADDFHLGNRAVQQGYRVHVCDFVVETVLPRSTWHFLFSHQLRWARTNRSVRPGGYLALVLTHGITWALLGLVLHPSSGYAWAAFCAVLGIRAVTAPIVARRYLGARFDFTDLLLLLPKDLFATIIWATAFLGNSVTWSGHEFQIVAGGEMVRSGDGPGSGRVRNRFAVEREKSETLTS